MPEHLLTIRDVDIFNSPPPPADFEYTQLRTAVKVIIFDTDDKIALVGTKYRLLPGGGVEEGETLEEAVIRECKEEVGCDVAVVGKVGTTEEYRAKQARRQITHYFVARVIGEKGNPTTTQDDERGMQVEWMALMEAHELLARQVVTIPHESYNSCFNVRCQRALVGKFMDDNLSATIKT